MLQLFRKEKIDTRHMTTQTISKWHCTFPSMDMAGFGFFSISQLSVLKKIFSVDDVIMTHESCCDLHPTAQQHQSADYNWCGHPTSYEQLAGAAPVCTLTMTVKQPLGLLNYKEFLVNIFCSFYSVHFSKVFVLCVYYFRQGSKT